MYGSLPLVGSTRECSVIEKSIGIFEPLANNYSTCIPVAL